MDRAERQKILEACPWITKMLLLKFVRCEGVKWSQVSLKHLYYHGPNRSIPPLGIPDKARCKKYAAWHFQALKEVDHPAKDGLYCWHHLMSLGIYYSMEEQERFDSWYEKYKEEKVNGADRDS